MPNPFNMFGSDAGPSSSPSSPRSASFGNIARSASPSRGPAALVSQPLPRPASHGRLSKLMVPGRSRSSSSTSLDGNASPATAIPVVAYADDTGLNSGRATPEQRRRTAKAAAQSLLASDGKYKKFASLVDRSLQSFDTINEWADFISFLSRLLKTLQTPSPAYSEIPRKLIVAKRLAQCLNPALPSGVHTMALDVYQQVFSMIGVEGLKRDLLIWSSGLFPFFQYAATSVRPALISLYETYYLPLGEDLRPAAKALILALLPGIEEETGDFFDQVYSLLVKLSKAVSPDFFLQNVFLVLISSPASRLAALNYVSRKLVEPTEPLATGTDVGLMIRGIAAVLSDDNMLARRGGLDLLLKVLPLDGPIVKDANQGDRELLVRAVSAVVLQRDVSLSRRVYTWLLSGDDSKEAQVAYFRANGLELLSRTLKEDMEKLFVAQDMTDAQVPFKIFLSLLDKWEIGEVLSETLAIPCLTAIHAAVNGSNASEISGLAPAVYEAMEPSVLWKKLYYAIDKELEGGGTKHLQLLHWLLTAIPQHDDETIKVHVPILLARILHGLGDNKDEALLTTALPVANALLSTIPPSLFGSATISTPVSKDATPAVADLAYVKVDLDAASSKVRNEVAPGLVRSIFKLSQAALRAGWSASSLVLVVNLAQTVIDREVPALSDVDSRAWIAAVLLGLERVHSFAVVGALVDVALMASRTQLFDPPIDITNDRVMSVVLDSLFRYLRADAAPYHARAVELLWEFNQLAEIHILESVIARRMSSPVSSVEAFDAFGVLWRQSDDTMLPGEIFHVPMFMVLDGLKSDDPQVLRTSETWMRCNLRSYFRMVDPLLRRVMEILSQSKKNPKLRDLSLIHYYISSATSLFRFGGQGLSKACQSSEIRKSPNSQLVARAEELFPEAVTYLDVLTELLTTLLNDNENDQQTLRVQSSALELLLYLVSRDDLSPKELGLIKATLVEKLTVSTQHRRLTLQNTMLHLLHSALVASEKKQPRGHRSTSSTFSIPEKSPPVDDAALEFEKALNRMIIVGVSSPGNRPILQHWVDFVLMTIPHLENKPAQLRALCDCFCEQLRMTMAQLRNTFTVAGVDDTSATITESEPIMLIGVLERLAAVLGGKPGQRRSEDKDKQNGESGGILGYLPMFSIEAPPEKSSKSETYGYLDDIVDAFLMTWSVTEPVNDSDGTNSALNPCAASRAQIMSRTRTRTKKALEKMFKSHPSELMSSCVQVWAMDSSDITDYAIFDCIDVLTPSAQKVVDLVTEHMSGKGRGSISENSNLALAAFLEAYISRLEGPIAVQVWNSQYSYARDTLAQSNTPSARGLLFPIFRCLTVLGKIVSTTSALEDRRLRRDLQETYVKLFDTVLSNIAKIVDSATWERGSKRDASLTEEERSERGLSNIYKFISSTVIGTLRTFLVDNDRVATVCASVSSSIIVPAFKQQKVDDAILSILQEMTKIPAAVKAWRLPVSDAFNDTRFFKMTPEESARWKPLVCGLMDSDKERITDLLGRIAAAPSANIFTNRELEMISRSYNLRRLSFVLLAAQRNHHLNNLPIIQEKLVEILRTTVVSPRVHSEVYLCLRVLMCRISPQHLANFWPVILAELLRVFESTMDDPPADDSENLTLVLAACKFLDLLLVIQTEDFQIHQWIFVTDTTDAAYPPENYSPEALMDRLAEILLEHAGSQGVQQFDPLSPRDRITPRRPQLSKIKTLTSLRQLQPFFSRASIETFEGVYADAGVDWDAIEDGLVSEIFEGESEKEH